MLFRSCTESLCPSNCNGHGFCTDAGCVCYDGWKGEECETPICPHDCTGHGVCEAGGCKCDVGRSGDDCSKAANPVREVTADVEAPDFEDGRPKADCEGKPQGAMMLSQSAAFSQRLAAGERGATSGETARRRPGRPSHGVAHLAR